MLTSGRVGLSWTMHGTPSHRPIERVEDELRRRTRSPALPRFQPALAVRLGPQAGVYDRLPHGQIWQQVEYRQFKRPFPPPAAPLPPARPRAAAGSIAWTR